MEWTEPTLSPLSVPHGSTVVDRKTLQKIDVVSMTAAQVGETHELVKERARQAILLTRIQTLTFLANEHTLLQTMARKMQEWTEETQKTDVSHLLDALASRRKQ